jgi:hypothetical protein
MREEVIGLGYRGPEIRLGGLKILDILDGAVKVIDEILT